MTDPRRPLGTCGLHLAALWALAFVQPLFDLLGRNADFFVARHNTRADIIVFAIGFTVGPPLAMLAVESVARRIRPALQEGIHLLLVAALAAALFLQILKDNLFSGPAGLLIVLAIGLGIAGAVAYGRTRFVPSLLSVLSVAPVLFCALFLLFSDVSKLVLPQREATAARGVEARDPVVIVVMDETPISTLVNAEGDVDAELFPHLAELARQSTWYSNATSTADKTPRSIPAMLTGNNPGYSQLPTASEQPDSIFTLLGRTYRVSNFETATALCPRQICPAGPEAALVPSFPRRMRSLVSDLRIVSEHLLLPDAIRADLPPVNQAFGNFAGDTLKGLPNEAGSGQLQLGRQLRKQVPGSHTQLFVEFVRSISAHRRSLYFIYFQVPHYPWQHYPNGKRYTTQGTDIGSFLDERGRWTDDEWLVGHAYERYLLQMAYADGLIGRMIARLKDKGVWDRSVVVITADHGAAFIPGVSRRDAERRNFAEIATIPLIIKGPGQRKGRVVEQPVDSLDVLPTIAELLGVEIPWEVEGDAVTGEDDRPPGPDTKITIAASSGDELTIPFSELVSQRARAVSHRIRLFGSGLPADRLFRFGPRSELIGRQVSTLAAAPPTDARLDLDDPERWSAVDTGRALLPGEVKGTLTGVPAGRDIAVAFNGRIETTVKSVDDDGEIRLLSLVPAEAIRPGPNDVAVYLILGDGRPSLQRIGGMGG